MTTPTSFATLALGAALLSSVATGCDTDTASPADYRVVAHADVASLMASPLVADAMKKDKLTVSAELGPCADLVDTTTAVTFGANEDAFELYIEGKFTAKQSKACTDHVAAEIAKKRDAGDKAEEIDTVHLGDGLFALYHGPAKPTRGRLGTLRAADPSPAKSVQSAWFVVHDDANKGNVEHVEGWASLAKGFDGHIEAHFDTAAAATELFAQAQIGLVAMRMSDEMGELAKAIKLSSGGDTLTAEVHASNDQLRKLMASAKANAKVDRDSAERRARIEMSIQND